MGEMKVGHTPGPWIADVRMTGCFAVVAGPHRGFTICSRNGNAERASELVADARLIAAAPELLAALRSLQAFAAACDVRLTEVGRGLSRDFEHGDVITFARAAIAKAEGR